MLQIKHREKPSAETLRQYAALLENYLSAHRAKIEIVLYEQPIDIHSFINGIETEVVRHWIDGILVSTPEVKNLKVRMFFDGIGEDLEAEVWTVAYDIQDKLYNHLKRDPGAPSAGGPYWQLWGRRKNKTL